GSALIVFASRDLYRPAVFFLITPLCTDLSMTPKVFPKSALASAGLPAAMTARTFLSWVLSRWRFIWFTTRRFWLCRYRLTADGWFAIYSPSKTPMITHAIIQTG